MRARGVTTVELDIKHDLLAKPDGSGSACKHCGAESEVRLVDGRVQRSFRRPGGEWLPELLCLRPAAANPPPVQAPAASKPSDAVSGIVAVLKKQYPEAFAPEIIGGHDVREAAKSVDLDVECSPVLWRQGSRHPAQVSLLEDGRYRVHPSEDDLENWSYTSGTYVDVSAEELRVMRARFLLVRAELYRTLHLLPPKMRETIESLFFPGGVFVPASGSRLAEVMATGQPLTIQLENGKTHAQVLAELLAEAGEERSNIVFAGEDGKLYTAPLVPSDMPLPGPPPARDPVPCAHCGAPTPGGFCDNCVRVARECEIKLSEMRGRFAGEAPEVSKARWTAEGRDLRAPAPPQRAELRPPVSAVLKGEHDARCCFGQVNDPLVLDVTKLPKGFALCHEHWKRVKAAQGGRFRSVAHREYVGNRYR